MRSSADPCPRCGETDVSLVDPTEDVWDLDPDEFEDEAEVWHCLCGWYEEATLDESIEESLANLEWVMGRLAAIDEAKP